MTKTPNSNSDWLIVIKPKDTFLSLNLKEVWQYRDLLFLFVKRDMVTIYKQTILGPLWYIIQPLFSSLIFTILFNNIAGIQTAGTPPFLFNLAGITLWNYFAACLTGTSDTFKANAHIFGKVYFPRIITPLSVVISNLLRFGLQFLIFISFYVFFYCCGYQPNLTITIVFFPILVAIMGVLGLGLGMLVSSMVYKYRDLIYLINFGVQLLMYLSAVMYPMELVYRKLPNYSWLVTYNPLAYFIETARFMLLGIGENSSSGLWYALLLTMVIFCLGLLIFNRAEKHFIDTV